MSKMITKLHISPIRAFADNYIWVIHNNSQAAVIDPGDAAVVIAFLQQHQLTLTSILITHHHHDHVGGIAALVNLFNIPVYGPASETIPHLTVGVQEGNTVRLQEFALDLQVLDIPGHTSGHIAYYGEAMLFCGDTLFGCGCGRLFEGTPAQMLASLTKLSHLPATTGIYCGHEYTLSNIEFALSLEPDNSALLCRAQIDRNLIALGQPTLPSSIAMELTTNPFLRCHTPQLQGYVSQISGKSVNATVEVFSILRALKNNFQPSEASK